MIICKLKFENHCHKKQLRKEPRVGNSGGRSRVKKGTEEREVKQRWECRASCFACVHTAPAHVRPACKHSARPWLTQCWAPPQGGYSHSHGLGLHPLSWFAGREHFQHVECKAWRPKPPLAGTATAEGYINSAVTQVFAAIGAACDWRQILAPAASGLSSSMEREVLFNVKPCAPVVTYVLACVHDHVVVV